MVSLRLSCARQRRSRGFTLAELMVVVTLISILAVIGIASFRRQAQASKSTEAAAVVQAIRSAEESYRAENQGYLNVSTDWFPAAPNPRIYEWHATTHSDWDPEPAGTRGWKRLDPRVTKPVLFRYKVNAPPATLDGLALEVPSSTWTLPVEPWYVIQAKADADGDGDACYAIATSWTSDFYIQNEGE